MLFGGNVVRSDHWVILSYMVPLLEYGIGFGVFFRNKNIMIVIIIEYASK